ncbi:MULTISPECIES: metal-dependent hydrolase [Paenibacillus]|uniref:Metal-dependent hydrolase n=1 Tax=Paenibacillus anseongense TaxID=2682845 RepID=A0ABW9UDF2_9BACL|nr:MULTISPECIES: metal-dependent hydrolase [Paenibacillus]MBA2938344.1 metal-dependent hydrolase [Paenibacillus sp. CGMCC 1.16610]MVQ37402.1 metal-dependent hydrolase [Paenibacillus anseongense]
MLQKTHSIAGFISAELVLAYQDVSFFSWDTAGALLLGCLAGTLADVDKPGSTMAKVLFPLSALLRILKVKHRTLTHSIVFILLLMMISLPMSPLYFWVFIVAYASHPLIDLLNERGIQLFWPLPMKIRLLPKFIAIDTGSTSETVFRWLLLAVTLLIPFMLYVYPMLQK